MRPFLSFVLALFLTLGPIPSQGVIPISKGAEQKGASKPALKILPKKIASKAQMVRVDLIMTQWEKAERAILSLLPDLRVALLDYDKKMWPRIAQSINPWVDEEVVRAFGGASLPSKELPSHEEEAEEGIGFKKTHSSVSPEDYQEAERVLLSLSGELDRLEKEIDGYASRVTAALKPKAAPEFSRSDINKLLPFLTHTRTRRAIPLDVVTDFDDLKGEGSVCAQGVLGSASLLHALKAAAKTDDGVMAQALADLHAQHSCLNLPQSLRLEWALANAVAGVADAIEKSGDMDAAQDYRASQATVEIFLMDGKQWIGPTPLSAQLQTVYAQIIQKIDRVFVYDGRIGAVVKLHLCENKQLSSNRLHSSLKNFFGWNKSSNVVSASFDEDWRSLIVPENKRESDKNYTPYGIAYDESARLECRDVQPFAGLPRIESDTCISPTDFLSRLVNPVALGLGNCPHAFFVQHGLRCPMPDPCDEMIKFGSFQMGMKSGPNLPDPQGLTLPESEAECVQRTVQALDPVIACAKQMVELPLNYTGTGQCGGSNISPVTTGSDDEGQSGGTHTSASQHEEPEKKDPKKDPPTSSEKPDLAPSKIIKDRPAKNPETRPTPSGGQAPSGTATTPPDKNDEGESSPGSQNTPPSTDQGGGSSSGSSSGSPGSSSGFSPDKPTSNDGDTSTGSASNHQSPTNEPPADNGLTPENGNSASGGTLGNQQPDAKNPCGGSGMIGGNLSGTFADGGHGGGSGSSQGASDFKATYVKNMFAFFGKDGPTPEADKFTHDIEAQFSSAFNDSGESLVKSLEAEVAKIDKVLLNDAYVAQLAKHLIALDMPILENAAADKIESYYEVNPYETRSQYDNLSEDESLLAEALLQEIQAVSNEGYQGKVRLLIDEDASVMAGNEKYVMGRYNPETGKISITAGYAIAALSGMGGEDGLTALRQTIAHEINHLIIDRLIRKGILTDVVNWRGDYTTGPGKDDGFYNPGDTPEHAAIHLMDRAVPDAVDAGLFSSTPQSQNAGSPTGCTDGSRSMNGGKDNGLQSCNTESCLGGCTVFQAYLQAFDACMGQWSEPAVHMDGGNVDPSPEGDGGTLSQPMPVCASMGGETTPGCTECPPDDPNCCNSNVTPTSEALSNKGLTPVNIDGAVKVIDCSKASCGVGESCVCAGGLINNQAQIIAPSPMTPVNQQMDQKKLPKNPGQGEPPAGDLP